MGDAKPDGPGRYYDPELVYDANLYDDDMYSDDMTGSDLHCADMRGANLLGVDLRGADLRGTDLTGAELRGAELAGVVWSTGPEGTRWPDGLAEAVRARSREVEPGLWRVADAEEDAPRPRS